VTLTGSPQTTMWRREAEELLPHGFGGTRNAKSHPCSACMTSW
jgi:hypothetical protein